MKYFHPHLLGCLSIGLAVACGGKSNDSETSRFEGNRDGGSKDSTGAGTETDRTDTDRTSTEEGDEDGGTQATDDTDEGTESVDTTEDTDTTEQTDESEGPDVDGGTPPLPTISPTTPVAPGEPQPPPPPRPPPGDKCSESSSSGTNQCYLETYCEDRYESVWCDRVDDKYRCSCNSRNSSKSYDITGVQGDSACELMMDLCATNHPLDFSGPSACTDSASSDQYSCNTQERCGPSATLTTGAVVYEIQSENYANCYNYDMLFVDEGGAAPSQDVALPVPIPRPPGLPGGMQCDCGVNGTYRNVQLTGASMSEACGYAINVCEQGDTLAYDGPEVCDANSTSQSSSSCYISQNCSRSADLGNGVSALLADYRGVSCSSGSPNWSCACDTSSFSVGFELPPESNSGLTCDTALSVCAGVGSAEPEGPIECAPNARSSGPQYCDLSQVCGQSAVVDGVELTVNGYLNVSCYDNGDGEYTCTCYSGNASVSFAFPSTATPRVTCDEAIVECEDLIDVQLGGSGGGGVRPPIAFDDEPAADPGTSASGGSSGASGSSGAN